MPPRTIAALYGNPHEFTHWRSPTKTESTAQETFTFACECAEGPTPDLTEYKDTLPYYVCEATFAQCIENNASDAEAQQECKDNRTCGSKDASKAETPSETTSGGSEPTGMTTATKGSEGGDATNTGASAPTQTGAAIANTPATGAFTAAVVAAFGFFL